MKARLAGLRGAPSCLAATVSARDGRADLLDEAWKRGNEAHLRGDYAAAASGLRAARQAAADPVRRSLLQPGRHLLPAGAARPRHLGLRARAGGRPRRRGRALQPGPGAQAGRPARPRQAGGRRARAAGGSASSPTCSPSTEVWLFCGLYLGLLRPALRAPRHGARLAPGRHHRRGHPGRGRGPGRPARARPHAARSHPDRPSCCPTRSP